MSASITPEVHLLVLVHGMWGNPNNLAEMKRTIDELKCEPSKESSGGVELVSLVATNNQSESTYDGIDWGGERVAEEVIEEIERLEKDGKKVTRFSITGYSLGGLLSRYVIGIMHQRKMFDTITPVNFNTIATPHIGLIRFPSIWSRTASVLGPKLLSRTGEQFYSVDKWSAKGRPLLEVMADPERIFFQALSLFPHIRIYANAINDITVPYLTACMESHDPFLDHKTSGITVEFDEKYHPIIKSWHVPETPPPVPEGPRALSKEWFQAARVPSLPLPPRLQFGFPLNLVMWAAVPILVPTFLALVTVRFTLSSRSSRQRIKLLESDPSARDRLVHVFAELERQMEDVVVEMVDNSEETEQLEPLGLERPEASFTLTPMSSTPDQSTPTLSPPADGETHSESNTPVGQEQDDPEAGITTVETKSHKCHKGKGKGKVSAQADLTPLQHKMLSWLNSIPQLEKERAYIDHIRNSHGTIIARDLKTFEFHKIGLGVLRHWADKFVI